jgi:hypothetical protein
VIVLDRVARVPYLIKFGIQFLRSLITYVASDLHDQIDLFLRNPVLLEPVNLAQSLSGVIRRNIGG